MPTDQVCAVADPGSRTRRVVIAAAVGGLLSFTLGGLVAIAAGLVALWALPQVPARAHTSALLILALIGAPVLSAGTRLMHQLAAAADAQGITLRLLARNTGAIVMV